jgi:uncharacterized membrane protein YdjX (TVP38/TMEM64 family)
MDSKKSKITKLILFLVWMAVVGFLIYKNFDSGTSLTEYPSLLREWLASFGMWGPLVYISFYAIRPLTFFPATLLTTIAGVAFGPLYGLLYTIVGENISAATSFFVGRFFGESFFRKLFTSSKLKVFDSSLSKNGFMSVLIMRLIFLPFDLVGYFSGAYGFRYRDFALGTFVGIMPGLTTFVLLGSGFMDPRNFIFSGIVFVVGLVIARVLKQRKTLQSLRK